VGAAAAPLAPLSQAHEHTLRQCEALARLVIYLGQCEPDAQTLRASQDLLNYFDTVEARQHLQEEQHLYPALVESMAGSDAVCLREMASSLTRQHRLLEALWRRLRSEVEAIAAGRPAPSVITDAEEFVRLSRAHIEDEESEVMPMALRLIGDDALQRLGANFQPCQM
jgi:hemerythrin-like domain-containing protein